MGSCPTFHSSRSIVPVLSAYYEVINLTLLPRPPSLALFPFWHVARWREDERKYVRRLIIFTFKSIVCNVQRETRVQRVSPARYHN